MCIRDSNNPTAVTLFYCCIGHGIMEPCRLKVYKTPTLVPARGGDLSVCYDHDESVNQNYNSVAGWVFWSLTTEELVKRSFSAMSNNRCMSYINQKRPPIHRDCLGNYCQETGQMTSCGMMRYPIATWMRLKLCYVTRWMWISLRTSALLPSPLRLKSQVEINDNPQS